MRWVRAASWVVLASCTAETPDDGGWVTDRDVSTPEIAWQVGVVTEVDEKQGIRVQVGALRTWVREDELLLVGSERDRPMLRSSHRKDPKRGPSDP